MAMARYLLEDVDEPVGVYTGRLGFRAARKLGPVTFAHRGDLELRLSGPESSGLNQEGAAPGGWSRIVLELEELEEVAAGLTLRGERRRAGPAQVSCTRSQGTARR
jgi:hypothetical protein